MSKTGLSCLGRNLVTGAASGAGEGGVTGGLMYLNSPGPKSVSGFLKATGGGAAGGAVLGAPMGAVSKITGQACFTADTQVLMADGTSNPIQDIQVGDEVLAWNHATGTNEAKQVVETFTHDAVETWEVETTQGVVTSTAEHPFYVEGRGWTPVKELHPGDRIATNTGHTATVERVEATGQTATVYNFHVADLHNYHVGVGNDWARVHNDCTPTRGGVYSLVDDSGLESVVLRTGRSKNLAARELSHANNPELRGLRFQVEHYTDDYFEQRGLEHLLYEANPRAMAALGGFNKIRAISPLNPKKMQYIQAAARHLAANGEPLPTR